MTRQQQLLFGERLRKRRKALHYTQEYVAEQVGITLRFYQMIERGEKSVSLDTLIALRKALTISMDSRYKSLLLTNFLVDFLLLGELPSSCENPITEILSALTPSQREDAAKILALYASACKAP